MVVILVVGAEGEGKTDVDEDGDGGREGKEEGCMSSATRRTPPGLRKAARRWVARAMEGRWWYARTHYISTHQLPAPFSQ